MSCSFVAVALLSKLISSGRKHGRARGGVMCCRRHCLHCHCRCLTPLGLPWRPSAAAPRRKWTQPQRRPPRQCCRCVRERSCFASAAFGTSAQPPLHGRRLAFRGQERRTPSQHTAAAVLVAARVSRSYFFHVHSTGLPFRFFHPPLLDLDPVSSFLFSCRRSLPGRQDAWRRGIRGGA